MNHSLLRQRTAQFALLIVTFAILSMAAAQADGDAKPFLHPLFTDNMVLQRGVSDPVWGWTTPGTVVTVRVAGKGAKAVAGTDGKWIVKLPPLPVGGPYTLTVTGPQTVTLNNVLVGDVWICSGQSNMQFGIGNGLNAPAEIAAANYPQIRLFTLIDTVGDEPRSLPVVQGAWATCTPQTISTGGWNGFSAVAYFFGRDLQQAIHVPIGLIHTSWGGTVAEAWTSAEALNTLPDFQPAVAAFQKNIEAQKTGETYDQKLDDWYAKNDPGSAAMTNWADPNFDVSAWKTMNQPTYWGKSGIAEAASYPGVVWLRREFDLPPAWAGKDLMLHLGPVDDADTTWINGVKVGGLDQYNLPRDYKVPASALKSGRNVLMVRVLNTAGDGGIYGTPDQLAIQPADDTTAAPLSLAGPWVYHLGGQIPASDPVPSPIDGNPNQVTVLYNGMIAPLVPFGVRGAIWYQGEANVGRGKQYQTLLPALIQDWRTRFGVGQFPFFIVQLANLGATPAQPGESGWAELREAQLLTSERVPKTGIAVTVDIGDQNDIHPKNKQEVGRRLALAAEAIAYGEKVEYSGPLYQSMTVEGSAIRLHFTHLGGGLVAQGGDKLSGFAIAGADGHFVWADAKIDGDTVLVSAPTVTAPTTVRYAWADNPAFNLYNKAGLPASPFRTDGDGK